MAAGRHCSVYSVAERRVLRGQRVDVMLLAADEVERVVERLFVALQYPFPHFTLQR